MATAERIRHTEAPFFLAKPGVIFMPTTERMHKMADRPGKV